MEAAGMGERFVETVGQEGHGGLVEQLVSCGQQTKRQSRPAARLRA
jgi:hypothetical protein